MTDADAPFVRAVCANPGDDLCRLVFADRLEETSGVVSCRRCVHGGYFQDRGLGPAWRRCESCHGTGTVSDGRLERAEFIRVQCEIARLELTPHREHKSLHDDLELTPHREHKSLHDDWCEGCAAECDLYDLRRRERELLLAHWRAWVPELRPGVTYEVVLSPRWEYSGTPAVEFRRGFPASLTCTAAELLDHAAAVFGAAPVERVVVVDKRPLWGSVVGPHQYHWFDPATPRHFGSVESRLPLEIWNRLTAPMTGDWSTAYPTAEAALADLSAAAIAFGRSAAGLPAWGPAGVRADGSGAYVEGGRATTSGGPTLWPGGA